MPLGTCDACGRFYVIPHEEAPHPPCRHCQRVLRVATHPEAVAALKESLLHPGPPQDRFEVWFTRNAQKARLLGERAQAAIAATQALQHQVTAQLLAARAMRRHMAQTVGELTAAVAGPRLADLLPRKAVAYPLVLPMSEWGRMLGPKRLAGAASHTLTPTFAVTSADSLAADRGAILAVLEEVEAMVQVGATCFF